MGKGSEDRKLCGAMLFGGLPTWLVRDGGLGISQRDCSLVTVTVTEGSRFCGSRFCGL